MVLAVRLSKSGLKVTVLESGDERRCAFAEELNEVVCGNRQYRGARLGRVRGLGGTSAIWGGALIPFEAEDLEQRGELGLPGWPVRYPELLRYVGEVENFFGLVDGPYNRLRNGLQPGTPPISEDFVARYAKWPSFSRRNVASLLRAELRSVAGLEIWLNATVTNFEVDRVSGRINSIVAYAPSQKSASLHARHFVLCAGAIESTRLLLWLNDQAGRPIECGGTLGRYFHDHISAPLAAIEATNLAAINRIGGLSFENHTMRSFRYVLTPYARQRKGLSGGFCHFTFAPPEGSGGADSFRTFMQSIQQNQINVAAFARVLADPTYVANVLLWRCIHKQLYWPRHSDLQLHFVVEQVPDFSNAISLSAKRDIFGVPQASISWAIRPRDVTMFRDLASCFDAFWRGSTLHSAGRLRWYANPAAIDEFHLAAATDVYHPGGTTRMGSDPSNSVVDADLTARGISNLSVASTSTFPRGGTANPTMMLLMLTMRLADRLTAKFASSVSKVDVRSSRGSHRAEFQDKFSS